jgi:hypothetical protein
MHPPSAAELLDAWERGLTRSAVERPLLLLAAAGPETAQSAADLARLSIGQRDGRLLTLREWTFGTTLAAVCPCPACGERLELTFRTDEVWVAAGTPQEDLSLSAEEGEVRFRLPDSADLAAVAGDPDRETARRHLLERCLLGSRPDDWSEDVLAGVARRMAEADPQADVRLALTCPACGHAWEALFDVAAFLWAEVDAWARRLLREVHTLASAYGWSEADILALSPRRRQFYLDMVGR